MPLPNLIETCEALFVVLKLCRIDCALQVTSCLHFHVLFSLRHFLVIQLKHIESSVAL